MIKKLFARLPAGTVGILSLATLLLMVARLAAEMPAGVTSVTLSEPTDPVPCTEGNCSYDPAYYSTARYDGCTGNGGEGMVVASEDFDGDSYLDIAVAISVYSTNKGRVYVIYGSADTPASTVDLCGSSSSIVSFTGVSYGDRLGTALAVGDATGNGYADLVIGSTGNATNTGKVYVLEGGSRWSTYGKISEFPALISITGPSNNTGFGSSLSLGNFSNSGNNDLLVGASLSSHSYLVFGPPENGTISSSGGSYNVVFNGPSSSSFGAAVGNAGDLNGDTIDDIVMGAPEANSGKGEAYLVAGRNKSSWITSPEADLTSPGSYSQVHTIIGNLTASDAPAGSFGAAVAGVGDVDKDNYMDVAIGAPTAPRVADPNATHAESGRIYVLFGESAMWGGGYPASRVLTDYHTFFYGKSAFDHLGATVSSAGDVDGDGSWDILVGGPDTADGNDDPGTGEGAVYLIPGRSSGIWPSSSANTGEIITNQPNIAFLGESEDDHVGSTVFGAEFLDFAGDGINDFLMGAGGFDVTASADEGRIYFLAFEDLYDQDGDGQSPAEGDCDDNVATGDVAKYDATGNSEVCDGADNDCDGAVDDADDYVANPQTFYRDTDEDGYGQTSNYNFACDQPDGYVEEDGDCNDGDAAINPDATEVCDGKDNDCDELTDDSDPNVTGQTTYYRDLDGDGFGKTSSGVGQFCASTAPTGYSASSADCNDGDAQINPDADEVCDGGVDNDCNTLADDDDPGVTDQNTYYADIDGDGFGNSASTTKTCATSAPSGLSAADGDCNDNNSNINPDATEICDNGVDNNCNGYADNFDDTLEGDTLYYTDSDGDGFGDEMDPGTDGCAGYPISGKVDNNDDCDDTRSSVNPDGQETCDTLDNDCDGLIDDEDPSNSGENVFYRDADSDGFGNPAGTTVEDCSATPPTGYADNDQDCNDSNSAINPDAQEVCDTIDNDCDDLTDDADDTVSGQNPYFTDADADGFGKSGTQVLDCGSDPPEGASDNDEDCNDTNPLVYPGAVEGQGYSQDFYGCLEPDSLDNDCDGDIDEGTCSSDDDGDGFNEYKNDCDDSNAAIYKDAAELCDNVDQDCDGDATNGYDTDEDGYLDAARCTGDPAGDDCNDGDVNTYPGAPETCDRMDNDCDGDKDEDFDVDGDSYLSIETCDEVFAEDCDDGNLAIHPGADEVCDDVDHDCDGNPINGFDYDEDGFASSEICQNDFATDCDDYKAISNPDATEICDGEDNDCDGSIADEQDDEDGDGFAVCNVAEPEKQDCNDSRADVCPGCEEVCDGRYNDCSDPNYAASEMPEDEFDADEDGFMVCENDCDDDADYSNPDADEICDEEDNDCNTLVDDDAVDAPEYYQDEDGDGSGAPDKPVWNCSLYDGIVDNSGDCNDADEVIYEGAEEICDGKDNDCDGETDPDVLYDRDQDGYLDADRCELLAGTIALDCDDSAASINPGVDEVLGDAIDNDCDGSLVPGSEETVFRDSGLGCSILDASDRNTPRGSIPLVWILLALPLGVFRWRRRM